MVRFDRNRDWRRVARFARLRHAGRLIECGTFAPIIERARFHLVVIKFWIISSCNFRHVFKIIKMTRHASLRRGVTLLRPFSRCIGRPGERAGAPASMRKEMEHVEIQTYNAGVVSEVPI
ncbi:MULTISPECIES: hypothetical protein [Burkholderia]|uniref:hypothetical protein n=1 Tax=Burkholderia TaxID=32008 RepID=UPI001583DFEA|nr:MULTISPECIES: hypothetical protein [Burkholderia]